MILITGATGHLGANLVRRLLKDGHKARVLVRERDHEATLEGIESVSTAICAIYPLPAGRCGMDACLSLRGEGLDDRRRRRAPGIGVARTPQVLRQRSNASDAPSFTASYAC